MKRTLFLIVIFCVLKANAQNYLISFASTGASTSVSTVKVENLTTGTTLTLNGSDVLRLTITTGIHSTEDVQSSGLKIYPNPMTDNSTLSLSPPVSGDATISIFDMTGKLLTQIKSKLNKGLQEFHLSGIKSGSYLISVSGSTYHFSGKLLSNGESDETIIIQKISNNQSIDEKKVEADSKGELATVDMNYTTGDRLKFTGISENYRIIKTDVPASSKTITFNFISCSDGDNNNYQVVEIGTQIWMAENLKTTKFNDGSAIPLVSDNTEWSNLTSPGYCWFNNDAANKEVYGVLFNWYTLDAGSNGGKNVCPVSWHVPSDADWNTLTTFLGGETVAGGKMKETGLAHWFSPNTGATNESGFSAVPGSCCYSFGGFDVIGGIGFYWSTAENISSTGWNRAIYSSYPDLYRMEYPKKTGFSVRCLKD
jgi:uncharacterized protein (TIGR02145 family)